ncbi:MAG: MBL fold metallo-hydrolase [Chloroflexi bacterium]|nr:MBL fold metallo-hydrolase [Chloroflexota bacterium]
MASGVAGGPPTGSGSIELADGVFAYIAPEEYRSNAGFVVASDEVLVIDSRMTPVMAQALRDDIRRFTRSDARLLVNTHFHGDHIFGNELFSPPAHVVAHSSVRRQLRTYGNDYPQIFVDEYHHVRTGYAGEILQVKRVVPPSITFDHALSVHLDGREIRLIHVGPAHTEGDIVVYLSAERVLFTGDLVFIDLHPWMVNCDLSGLIRAMERVTAWDVDIVVPGHGPVTTKSALVVMLEYYRALRHALRSAIADGLSVDQAVEQLSGTFYAHWQQAARLPSTIRRVWPQLQAESA